MEGIYNIDKASQIKLSSENPFITMLYDGLLKGKEHKLLHNHVEHACSDCSECSGCK
jgi:NADH-quinone oxidoreductase subunit G